METATPTRSVLLLDDGRKLEHPATVHRWDVIDVDDQVLMVTAARTGTKPETGESVTVARVTTVRP